MVCIFARKTSEPLASLVKQIDKKIGESNNLKSFVVILTSEGDKTKEDLKKLATDAGVTKVPLTMLQDPVGPPDYEIAKNADFTVLMWRHHKVMVNHAYKGTLTETEISAVVADISEDSRRLKQCCPPGRGASDLVKTILIEHPPHPGPVSLPGPLSLYGQSELRPPRRLRAGYRLGA